MSWRCQVCCVMTSSGGRKRTDSADIADVTIADFSQLDDLTAMACAALELVDRPVDVVGHSMGGRVAFEVWRLAPERVRTLVLLDTGAHPAGPDEPATRQPLLDVAAQGMRALAEAWLPPMVHPDRRTTRRSWLPWSTW